MLTGEEISFFVSFFDRANNRLNLLPYDFVIIQDGKQPERIPSTTQYGVNVLHHIFSNSGPINISTAVDSNVYLTKIARSYQA